MCFFSSIISLFSFILSQTENKWVSESDNKTLRQPDEWRHRRGIGSKAKPNQGPFEIKINNEPIFSCSFTKNKLQAVIEGLC